MFFSFLLAKIEIIIKYYIYKLKVDFRQTILCAYVRIIFVRQSKINCMKKFAKISLIITSCLLCLTLVCVGGFLLYINTAKSGVSFDKTMLEEVNTTIDIYDIKNDKINEKNGKKALVKLEELPHYVPECFVSIEDKDFYKHNGLNYKRMAKAFLNNIKSHSLKEGASTISQQLIKNTHLSSEKTLTRKLNEMALARELERTFSKDEIMETYLNIIYFGSGAYGIENASQTYFNKTAKELTLSESALLAGMIKSPRTYSPILSPEKALARRNLVLKEMQKDGKISAEEFKQCSAKPIVLSQNISSQKSKNLYEEAVIEEAKKILGISEKELVLGKYKIWSYQNPQDAKSLHETIHNKNYYQQNSYGNVADGCGIVIDNKTGGITAFDGKSIYDLISMKRSPGSAIKPILVYAPALELGKISPSTQILDEKTSFGTYTPHNVGSHYYGWIDATKSVEKSLNIPAIKIMQVTGIENCKKMAKNCGIKFEKADKNYAIALGGLTNGTSVKELVNTYLPFSNDGKFVEAKFIRKICNNSGKVIYRNSQQKKQVMSSETAYLMTEMLKSGVQKGTSSRLRNLGFEIAGKTGTVGISGTNYNSDVWSVAYTPQKTVGVWLGNSTGQKEFRLEGSNNGGTFCTSIVRDTFEKLSLDKSAKFEKPSGIVTLDLDRTILEKNHVLMLANPDTPERYKISADFNKKFAPTVVAEKFAPTTACTLTGSFENGIAKLEFSAMKDAKYKLYRIEEDERKLLKEFENVVGLQQYEDKKICAGTTYTYFVEVEFLDTKDKKVKTNSVKISVPNNQSNIKKLLNLW